MEACVSGLNSLPAKEVLPLRESKVRILLQAPTGNWAMVSAEVLYTYGFRFESEARGAVFKDCLILQKPDNKHFAFIRLYFMLFGFVKNCL